MDNQVARALESMERNMAMLEPSLKDLLELKGRMLAQTLEMEEHKQTLLQLTEERNRGDVD
eukprot:11519566-Prorocentrum_lima.AAC.1